MAEPHAMNGQAEERVANVLQDEVTVGYVPVMPLESLWQGGGDIPQITFRRDLEFMQIHPIVQNTLEYYKSGIAGTEFWGGPDHVDPQNVMGKPISMDPRVAQFVLALVERFWQRGVPIIQDSGYPYGWAPGEHLYKETGGMLVWDHLKAIRPRDGFLLTYGHKPVGVRVKGIRDPVPGTESCDKDKECRTIPRAIGGTADLWLASERVPAKGLWYPHRPRFNSFYGRSQLIGAWRPWRRLGWRDGVEQVIDAAIYRAGYVGPTVRYPPEDAQTAQPSIAATRLDGAGNPRRNARDAAMQVIQWAKAGAGLALSSAQYPATMGGGPKWDVEWPDHVMDVRPLVESARYLEDQIMLGIGVPPELVKSGGTGSGYSGRSIPREAFLDGQQRVADAMLQMFVEQVVRPLVLWNFGDIPFNVQCKSLLMSQADDKMGGGQMGPGDVDLKRSQAAKDAWQLRKQNENSGGGQPPAQLGAPTSQPAAAGVPPMAPAFSTDQQHSEKVLSIVRKVLQRGAA